MPSSSVQPRRLLKGGSDPVTVPEVFQKEGKAIAVEGNKPFLMTDPGYLWMVERGKVTVFTVFASGGEAVGARDFLFEAGPGDILLGVRPEGDEQALCLMATGLTGTNMLQLSWARFLEAAAHPDQRDVFISAVSRWAGSLAESTAAAMPSGIVWSGGMFWVGETGAEGSLTGLAEFHSRAVRAALDRRRGREQADNQRFHDKSKNDRRLMESALRRLLAAVQPGIAAPVGEEFSGDDLLDACRLVGHSLKLKIVPPPQDRKESSKDPLGDIAYASRVRLRKVLLKEEWWKQDNGPLLAYLEDDSRPVALIPLSPGLYEIHDPARQIKVRVDFETARQVKPFAFTFYRPFPDKAMKLSDVLVFGRENCWRQDFAMVSLMGILGGLLGIVVPVATGIVFDTVIPGGEKVQLIHVAFFLAASAVAAMFFQLIRSFAMQRILGKMDGSIQAAIWDRVLSLPVPFFRDYTSGELAMRAMAITQIRTIVSETMVATILTSIFSFFNLILLFYYNVKLAVLAVCLLALAIAVTYSLGRIMTGYERQVVDISNRISGLVLQFFGGVAKFRVAGAESRAFYQWSGEFSRQRKITFNKEIIGSWLETFNAVFPVAASMVIFYNVAASTASTLAPGQFIAFNAAFTSFFVAMIELSQILVEIFRVVPLFERAGPILEAMPEYDEAKVDPGELSGSIEVSHLNFRYKEDGPLILNDVSLHIKEGEYVGLVGTSGSGKSTLFRVVLGFEKPESGRIYYSGHDIEKVDIRELRRQLGVVLQNGKLLAGDIFTNIVGSNPNLTIDDAWETAKMVGLDRDIKEMPMGMHTILSEGATTLSGGQRQRLLIARAIVNRPKIIYFDEATSALDNKTQAIVSQSLDELKATRVVIAHRLSTIVNCDRIIVMDKGRIIEDGPYEELMNMNGVFADLARRQLA
ncbi:MAG: Toxin RTX-I translocation ATP-binding protein [Pelotomaculum sp. PtaB.Bin117]|nr:MAG: Toxin RTX-I translocation ATP-binding protein [Pelotomaculum sp. PtaB.Bin117]